MAGFTKDLAQARRGVLSWPLKVTVELTSRCPVACIQCGIHSGPNHDWTLADIQQFVKQNQSLTWVNLTGGELFAHPAGADIFEPWLELPRLALFHFPTSGWMLEQASRIIPPLHQKCEQLGVRFAVSVSVDGPKAVHDERRGRQGSFDRAIELLKRLRAEGVPAYPGMTLDEHNAPLVPETLEAIHNLTGISAEEVHFNLVHQSDHYYLNQHRQEPQPEVSPALAMPPQKGLSPRAILERKYREAAREYFPGDPSPLPCGVGKASLFLSADTTVYPCTIWNHPIGHLRPTLFDLKPIWQGMLRAQAREMIVRHQCPGCWTPCEAFVSLMVGGDQHQPGYNTIKKPALVPGTATASGV